jgi:hypothetical protein
MADQEAGGDPRQSAAAIGGALPPVNNPSSLADEDVDEGGRGEARVLHVPGDPVEPIGRRGGRPPKGRETQVRDLL